MERFSCLSRLLRVLSRCRHLFLRRSDRTIPPPLAPITSHELRQAFLTCVSLSQSKTYAFEIEDLSHGRPISSTSSLGALTPFLDESKVLRVGGRLDNSRLPFDEKHPVIIDGRCHLARMLIDWAHHRALHGGFRLTYTHLLKRAWLVRGRAQIKARLRRCVVCAKSMTRTMTQVMAPLPAARVTPSRPFSSTGVDYAGPFQILRTKGRGVRSSKGYVAVFVCFTTKAVHLELVGDLSTASFLGALTRFIGRRGRPEEIWSDNATNFRGANLELRRLFHEAGLAWDEITDSLASEGIKWQFIPPSAPHFGGLWEAGVKSMKTHLRRVVGPKKLTYEEFTTFLVEIEAVLNSRPIGPLTGDMDDLNSLTPAHFLVGESLSSYPQPNNSTIPLDHLTHWKLIKGLRDHFWDRWSREYLNTLQQRSK